MPSDNDVPTVKPAWMSPIETRQSRADYYFRTVLVSQREWYSKGARKQKRRYLAFAICVIVLGALISLLQVLETADWVRHLTAALGAAIAISRAVDTLLRPSQTWQAYRKAAEGMKREYRLYLHNANTACISTTRMPTPPQRTRPAPIVSWSSGSKPLSPKNSNYSGSLQPRVGPSRNHRNWLTKAHEHHLQRLPIEMTAIFISHSSADNAAAAEMKAWLEAQGMSMFKPRSANPCRPDGRGWVCNTAHSGSRRSHDPARPTGAHIMEKDWCLGDCTYRFFRRSFWQRAFSVYECGHATLERRLRSCARPI